MAQPASSEPHWADHLIYMEAGADILAVEPPAKDAPRILPGLLLAALVTAAALAASRALGVAAGNPGLVDPAMLAIVFGMGVANLWTPPAVLRRGTDFCVKTILPAGIVLLGARLQLQDVLGLGVVGVLFGAVVVASSLGAALLLARLFNLPRKLAILLGVGTGICGGSAIAATAPVIEADDEDVAFAVATVALLGLVSMFALPVLGQLLGLSQSELGTWAGLTVHQTPQAVAAGFAYGIEAGETATLVKMVRVSMLAPAVFAIGLIYTNTRSQSGPKRATAYGRLFPTFVLGFLAMVGLRSLGLLPDLVLHFPASSPLGGGEVGMSLVDLAGNGSRLCIALAMAAVGLETRFALFGRTGLRPLAAATGIALAMWALVLGLLATL